MPNYQAEGPSLISCLQLLIKIVFLPEVLQG